MGTIPNFVRWAVPVLAAIAPFACSSEENGGDAGAQDDIDASTSGSGEAGASPTSASGTTGGVDGSINVGDGTGTVDINGEPCAAQVTRAELVDIDIHLMLDSSSSMLDLLPNGDSKWQAIVDSLIDFVEDPATADIGIGLQYFPKLKEDATLECFTDADCAAGAAPCSSSSCVLEGSANGANYLAINASTTAGVCDGDDACASDESCRSLLGVCVAEGQLLVDGDNILVCESNADCPAGSCDLLGYCEYLDAEGLPIPCTANALTCPAGAGTCGVYPYNCTNATLCEAGDYAGASVDVSVAADRNDALVASLTSHEPNGLTPTAPALAGAIQHAQEREASDPTRKVVAVLATDGLPTVCEPIEIGAVSEIARAGVQGSPSVETYVVGVFSSTEAQEAQANLNQIAAAGGTGEAFIITTGNDVTTLFLQALEEIRGAALSCDFAIPEPAGGQALDFGQVNLEFMDSEGESRQLVNVSDEAACNDAAGTGWYYVRDAQSNEPRQISVCPDVCNEFQSAMGASQVNLQIGCATIIK